LGSKGLALEWDDVNDPVGFVVFVRVDLDWAMRDWAIADCVPDNFADADCTIDAWEDLWDLWLGGIDIPLEDGVSPDAAAVDAAAVDAAAVDAAAVDTGSAGGSADGKLVDGKPVDGKLVDGKPVDGKGNAAFPTDEAEIASQVNAWDR
jgi:hypothetical protein